MGEKSKIQWTDATWNIAVGCTKVNADCKFCYMMRDMGERWGQDVNNNVKRTSKATFNKPLIWQKKGLRSKDGRPLKVFTCSLTDPFHPEIDSYRDQMWKIIKACPDLIFQILTKRPERIKDCLPDDWDQGYPNVWLGASAGHTEAYHEMIQHLTLIPAKKRFLSLEPLIDFIDLSVCKYLDSGLIDWVIIGGESGNETGKYRYRRCELDWIQDMVDECRSAGVSVFVKQMGTYLAKKWGYKDRHGGKMEEWPKSLQIRQIPT